MKNNLGQPTISDVATFFCDPCNAVLCAGCPINDILQAEQAAQQSVHLTASGAGGRKHPARAIKQIRQLLVKHGGKQRKSVGKPSKDD